MFGNLEKTNQQLSELLNNRLDLYRICCFTNDELNSYMWGHYGSSNTGFCIGLEVDKAVKLFHPTFKVAYQDKRISMDYIISEGKRYEIIELLTTKLSQWRNEKEFRTVKIRRQKLMEYGSNVKNDNIVSQYFWESGLIEESGLYNFPPTALKEVIIGSKSTKCLLNKLYKILNLPKYQHVQLYKVIVPIDKPNLEKVPIILNNLLI